MVDMKYLCQNNIMKFFRIFGELLQFFKILKIILISWKLMEDSRTLEKYFTVSNIPYACYNFKIFWAVFWRQLPALMEPSFFGESKDDRSAAIRGRLPPHAPAKGDRPRMTRVIKMDNPDFYIGRFNSTDRDQLWM